MSLWPPDARGLGSILFVRCLGNNSDSVCGARTEVFAVIVQYCTAVSACSFLAVFVFRTRVGARPSLLVLQHLSLSIPPSPTKKHPWCILLLSLPTSNTPYPHPRISHAGHVSLPFLFLLTPELLCSLRKRGRHALCNPERRGMLVLYRGSRRRRT